MAMMGLPLADWNIYNEPMHAVAYTPPETPEMDRVIEMTNVMLGHLAGWVAEIRRNPRPGLIDAVITAEIEGNQPEDVDVIGAMSLLIGGGFDTTTSLTSHSWNGFHSTPTSGSD